MSKAHGMKQEPESATAPRLTLMQGKRLVIDSSDSELVVAHRQGDPLAFAELYRRHAKGITSWVRAIVRDRDLAEEITQDVFYKLHRNINQIDERKNVGGWLRIVARNNARDKLREMKRRRADISLNWPLYDKSSRRIEFEDTANGTERAYRSRYLHERIESALESFNPRHAAAFRLRELENKNYAEIAEILNVPLGTVKTYLFRARAKLMDILEPER